MVKENQTIPNLVKVEASTRSSTGKYDWEHERQPLRYLCPLLKQTPQVNFQAVPHAEDDGCRQGKRVQDSFRQFCEREMLHSRVKIDLLL